MEDVAKALEMVFAVMVFVIGLSIAISMFSLARKTSDTVLQIADETTYYDYEQVSSEESSQYRIVGLETIIPTIYKYSKENYRINFVDSSGSGITIYQSNAYEKLTENPKGYNGDYNYLDLNDEIARNEPWTSGSVEKENGVTTFINYLINGYSKNNLPYSNYNVSLKNNNGIIKKWSNTKFYEHVGKEQINEEEAKDYNKTTSKTIITYVKLN